MLESITLLVDSVVEFVRGALGIQLAERPSPVYAPAYALVPRRTQADQRRKE